MENEKVSVLIESGLKRNEAKTLLYLFEHNETVSRSIEREADLRQPEVSNAITSFSKKGWVSRRRGLKDEERGRPETIITLVKKKAEMMDDLKEHLKQRGIQIKETLEKLDKLF